MIKTVQCAIPTKQIINRPKQVIEIKKEENNDVFLSPTTIPASPVRTSRKRPRTEPLQLPVFHQSKLRATRSKPQGCAPYTPQPILNPQRPGTGLYSNLKSKLKDEGLNWNSEPIPESDSTPHINIGTQFQCNVPPFTSAPNRTNLEPTYEDLLWDPGINNCTDSEATMWLINRHVSIEYVQLTCIWISRAALQSLAEEGIRNMPCIFFTCVEGTF
ncbi:hypothetical protein NQ314_019032, partial [Rhamnusium bicolor]